MYCKNLIINKKVIINNNNKYLSKKFKTQVFLNRLANVGYNSGNLLSCNTYFAK